jgi:hypothetical protein
MVLCVGIFLLEPDLRVNVAFCRDESLFFASENDEKLVGPSDHLIKRLSA